MRCPFCKEDDDKVIDSRASNDGFAIRRRRECLSCERRFTTYERIEESPLRVVKKDGTREPFERRKILLGMIKASEKRPILIAPLEEATEEIQSTILARFDSEVPSAFIGQLVMDALKRIDQVAYVRFASVYREFEDVAEFAEAVEPLMESTQKEKAAKSGSTKRSTSTASSKSAASKKQPAKKSSPKKSSKKAKKP